MAKMKSSPPSPRRSSPGGFGRVEGKKALLIGEDGQGSEVNLPLKGVKAKQLNWVSERAKEPNQFPAPAWAGGRVCGWVLAAAPRLESPLDVHIKFPL